MIGSLSFEENIAGGRRWSRRDPYVVLAWVWTLLQYEFVIAQPLTAVREPEHCLYL
jgi:hypothetical protein